MLNWQNIIKHTYEVNGHKRAHQLLSWMYGCPEKQLSQNQIQHLMNEQIHNNNQISHLIQDCINSKPCETDKTDKHES